MTRKKVVFSVLTTLLFLPFIGWLIRYFLIPSHEWVSAISAAVSALFSVASVVAVFLVWEQLQQNRRQLELHTDELKQTKAISQLQFEDTLAKEYRELASRIPTKALLGIRLSSNEYADAFDELFRYVDLSNEQVTLRMNNRIGQEVWITWRDGIKFNLGLPTFKEAWRDIKCKTSSFQELRKLEDQNFDTDPILWIRK